MHIFVLKPKIAFVEGYYYNKTRRYSIACAIVDVRRRFINIFVYLEISITLEFF
jgi:hypothetical protein